jgi:hypothetical protein
VTSIDKIIFSLFGAQKNDFTRKREKNAEERKA